MGLTNGFMVENGCLLWYEGTDQDVTIPEGITSIGKGAFRDCNCLKNITIPEWVTSIGDLAFGDCRSLTSVTILGTMTYFGDEAFWFCDNLKHFSVPEDLKNLGKNPFGFDLPKGLIKEVSSFYHSLSDKSVKDYLLTAEVWPRLSQTLQVEIFLTKQGKTLNECYRKRIGKKTAEVIGGRVLEQLTGKASVKDCNIAGSLMTLLYEKLPAELLKELYEHLSKEKNGKKALQSVEEKVSLMEKIGRSVETNLSLPPIMQKVTASLLSQKKTLKDLEEKLKDCYGLTVQKLPGILLTEGTEADPHVLAWLLTAHEKYEEKFFGFNISYLKPEICPEAVEIINLLDSDSFQKALMTLADQYLVAKQNRRMKYLTYPICRYSNEENMEELTKRAPKWRTSSSGNDAPPLCQFRDAVQYSNTRAAMLFAEKYYELDKYATLRRMSEDELRDRYLSDIGLDEQGTKTYDLGSQIVTARLQKDLSFVFELPNGKNAKSLPKKGADTEKYIRAKTDFDEMRKFAKKILKNREKVLFDDFLSGRSRKSEEWQEAYLKNPLLRKAAGLIVWAQGKNTFTVTDEDILDSKGKPYTIKKTNIKVAHPMEMESDEVSEWQAYFLSNKIKQPFIQMWEPVVDPSLIKKDRYSGLKIPFYRFKGQERHGVYIEDNDYHNNIVISFEACDSEVKRLDIQRHFLDMNDTFEVISIQFETFTRQVNHIIGLLDKWTVYDRITKDDVSVADQLDLFTAAQIAEFIRVAQENNSVNVTALLLEYKKRHYPDLDSMEEFVLEW